jgi:hypothetical protein
MIISMGAITCGADGESRLPRAVEVPTLPHGASSQAMLVCYVQPTCFNSASQSA